MKREIKEENRRKPKVLMRAINQMSRQTKKKIQKKNKQNKQNNNNHTEEIGS